MEKLNQVWFYFCLQKGKLGGWFRWVLVLQVHEYVVRYTGNTRAESGVVKCAYENYTQIGIHFCGAKCFSVIVLPICPSPEVILAS